MIFMKTNKQTLPKNNTSQNANADAEEDKVAQERRSRNAQFVSDIDTVEMLMDEWIDKSDIFAPVIMLVDMDEDPEEWSNIYPQIKENLVEATGNWLDLKQELYQYHSDYFLDGLYNAAYCVALTDQAIRILEEKSIPAKVRAWMLYELNFPGLIMDRPMISYRVAYGAIDSYVNYIYDFLEENDESTLGKRVHSYLRDNMERTIQMLEQASEEEEKGVPVPGIEKVRDLKEVFAWMKDVRAKYH